MLTASSSGSRLTNENSSSDKKMRAVNIDTAADLIIASMKLGRAACRHFARLPFVAKN